MKLVRIQSDITIQVTDGLGSEDLTKVDSDVKDRLKIKPTWKRHLIKKGKGVYPAEIVEWATVKALEADGILTIGEVFEEEHEPEEKPARKTRKPAEGVVRVDSLKLDDIAR